jgi:UDP-glucose:(heptosyl)LPS alpha-1,3-glucosyltransferase
MIILLKSNLSTIGGLEKQTWKIINAIAQREPITVLTYNNSTNPSISNNVTIETIAKKPLLGWKRITTFNDRSIKWQNTHPHKITLSMDRTSYQTHIRLGNGIHKAFLENRKQLDSKLKHWSHQFNPIHQCILKIEKEAFSSPRLKKIFTNSHMVKKELLSFYDVDPKKIITIHNGVEYLALQEHFTNAFVEKDSIAHNLSLDPNCHHFLFIGNGYYRKGLKLILHALSKLTNKNFFFHIIGKDKNIKKYQTLAHKLHLDNNTHFYGQITNTIDFYKLCDTLLIPSFYDPFANVTIEALAMGLFVISSKFNGASEIIDTNAGITLNNLLDEEELIYALNQALNNPKTIKKATTIRNTISHLDFSSQIDKLVSALYD